MRPPIITLILLVMCGVDAFTSSVCSATRLRVGLPTIDQRRHEPPSTSGRCTCCIGDMTQRARSHAIAKTRTHLGLKRRDADQITKVSNNKDGRPAAAAGSSSGRKVTQIDDGSPLGVAIVVIGGAWVVLGDRDIGGDGGGGSGIGGDVAQIMLPQFLAPIVSFGGDGGGSNGSTDGRIGAVFVTASVAAGISRLARYYWSKK